VRKLFDSRRIVEFAPAEFGMNCLNLMNMPLNAFTIGKVTVTDANVSQFQAKFFG
jgi:hypothetical protein